MKLEVHERITLLDLLPKEGDYAALKDLRKHREMFSFDDDEIAFLQLRKREDGLIEWNTGKGMEALKDIPISEYVTSLIRDILSKMNKEGKLNDNTFSLYEKFVIAYQ